MCLYLDLHCFVEDAPIREIVENALRVSENIGMPVRLNLRAKAFLMYEYMNDEIDELVEEISSELNINKE